MTREDTNKKGSPLAPLPFVCCLLAARRAAAPVYFKPAM
jgi:hypothetical protein